MFAAAARDSAFVEPVCRGKPTAFHATPSLILRYSGSLRHAAVNNYRKFLPGTDIVTARFARFHNPDTDSVCYFQRHFRHGFRRPPRTTFFR